MCVPLWALLLHSPAFLNRYLCHSIPDSLLGSTPHLYNWLPLRHSTEKTTSNYVSNGPLWNPRGRPASPTSGIHTLKYLRYTQVNIYMFSTLQVFMCLYLQRCWTQLHLEFRKYVEQFVIVIGALVDLFSVRLIYIHKVHKYNWVIHQVFRTPWNLLWNRNSVRAFDQLKFSLHWNPVFY